MEIGGRLRGGRSRGRGGWGAGERRDPVFAALDLGTNNCRLLVARPSAEGLKVIDAFSRIVRLGEGMGRDLCLSEAAMARTIDALKICAEKMERRRVTHARSVATEACRRASNGEDFLARVTDETGLFLEVISTEEEARLAMAGCTPLLDPAIPHALLFDIGGGSTELIWLAVAGGAARMLASISLPFGVVGFAERYGGQQVDSLAYEAMVAAVSAALATFDGTHGIAEAIARGEVQMLGTSGTVTTIAGVHFNLPRYDRSVVDGCYLEFDIVRTVIGHLRGMSYEDRSLHPCVGRERADLVIAGLAILDGICRLWPVRRLRVADRGLREGILQGLLQDHRQARDPGGEAELSGFLAQPPEAQPQES